MLEVSRMKGAITRKLGNAWSSIIESSVITQLDCAMVHSATQVQDARELPPRTISIPLIVFPSSIIHRGLIPFARPLWQGPTQVQAPVSVSVSYLHMHHGHVRHGEALCRTSSPAPSSVVRHESPINRQQFRRAPSPKLIRDEARQLRYRTTGPTSFRVKDRSHPSIITSGQRALVPEMR